MSNEKHTENKKWYRENFTKLESSLNGEANGEIHAIRKSAIEDFDKLDYPTLKTEEWKYTNISSIISEQFLPAPNLTDNSFDESKLEDYCLGGFKCHKLVFVNGLFSEKLSKIDLLPGKVTIGSLRKLSKTNPELIKKYFAKSGIDENTFNALNRAYSLDGAFINIPDGVFVEDPIQLIYVNGNENEKVLSQPRNLFSVGKNSQVKIISNYEGIKEKEYLTNTVTEVFVEENGILELYKIQNESDNAYHIAKTQVVQHTSSTFTHFSLSLGGEIVRNDINSELDGETVECNLFGLYLANGKRHVDTHTFVDHAQPNSNSNELYKGILDDESRGVFSGKILVNRIAQKTNAFQSNKNVLLSKKAHVDTKPQLEIYADDVKCSHGATIGHLDDMAYFYIKSRGVPADIAKSMLIRAFANDVIEKISIEPLREKLNHMIFEHLHRVEI